MFKRLGAAIVVSTSALACACSTLHTQAPGVGAGTASAQATGSCFDPALAPALDPPAAPTCANEELVAYDGLLVLAPHPDDESLGFGGLAASYRKLGKPVTVFIVTDGDAYCE